MLFLPDFPRVTPLYLGGHTDILEEPELINLGNLPTNKNSGVILV